VAVLDATRPRVECRPERARAGSLHLAAPAAVCGRGRRRGGSGLPGTAIGVHCPRTAAAGKLSHLVRGGAIRPDISPDAHRGVDYRVPVGTLVLAVLSGVVYQAGWGGEAGLRVGIRHPGGLHSRYLHLSAVWLEVGQVVAAGTVVGLSGNTGRSTGPHLHVEVFRDFIRTLDSGGGGRGSSTCMPMPGTTRSRGRIPWGCVGGCTSASSSRTPTGRCRGRGSKRFR